MSRGRKRQDAIDFFSVLTILSLFFFLHLAQSVLLHRRTSSVEAGMEERVESRREWCTEVGEQLLRKGDEGMQRRGAEEEVEHAVCGRRGGHAP
ncbi:hypothetical protein GUJ93_ZPchr0007g5762 [Zizania palustris]|uniref:Uncharacterized protein n=1 Tax=Zizania palustris TaxID=103762 RepID=A0A8J5T0A5_ZIZPA|nr:hypothetical protein GUJ93_ZPchr0007g5762 [Zizania palustris]